MKPSPFVLSFPKGICVCLSLTATLILATTMAHAQGCVQCLDATRATPPVVQHAYREAIIILASAAATLFTIGMLLIRRNP